MKKLIIIIAILMLTGMATADVKQVVRKIVIENEKIALALPAYTDKDGSWNPVKSEMTFTVNSSAGDMWRLVHDGKTVITIIEGSDKSVTTSIYAIEEFKTEQMALDRVKVLGVNNEIKIAK